MPKLNTGLGLTQIIRTCGKPHSTIIRHSQADIKKELTDDYKSVVRQLLSLIYYHKSHEHVSRHDRKTLIIVITLLAILFMPKHKQQT